MAEAGGLNPLQHGFESHRGHALIALLAALARVELPHSLRSLCLIARFARCDVRREVAVFGGSDETIVVESALSSTTFRRLLLQIGGANIAGTDRAGYPPTSSSLADGRAFLLARPQHGGARSGVALLRPRFPCWPGSQSRVSARAHRDFQAWKKGSVPCVHLNCLECATRGA